MCLNLTKSSEIHSEQIVFCPVFKIFYSSSKQITAESLRELQLPEDFFKRGMQASAAKISSSQGSHYSLAT